MNKHKEIKAQEVLARVEQELFYMSVSMLAAWLYLVDAVKQVVMAPKRLLDSKKRRYDV